MVVPSHHWPAFQLPVPYVGVCLVVVCRGRRPRPREVLQELEEVVEEVRHHQCRERLVVVAFSPVCVSRL